MEFIAHASSSAGNLYEVQDGGARLLIEVGVRYADIQKALRHRVTSLDAALVSHHHGDHARAARDVLRAGVPVYSSAETHAKLSTWQHHRARILNPLREERVGPWTVVPFDLRHDADGALGFLVAAPSGDRLLYACDSAYVPYRFAGLTHIAVECNYSLELLRRSESPPEHRTRVLRTHMGLERVVGMLSANDLSRVRGIWLLHLSDQHSDAEQFRETVAAATGKPVHVAPRDLRDKENAA